MLQKLKKLMTSKTLIILSIFFVIALILITVYNRFDVDEIYEPAEVIDVVEELKQEQTEVLKQEQEVIKETETQEQVELTEEIPEGLHFRIKYIGSTLNEKNNKYDAEVSGYFVGADLGKYDTVKIVFTWFEKMSGEEQSNELIINDLVLSKEEQKLYTFKLDGYESVIPFEFSNLIDTTVELLE